MAGIKTHKELPLDIECTPIYYAIMKKHWNLRHGEAKAGKKTKEWLAWTAMIHRCIYPSMDRYYRYGGRGIKVCDLWRSSYESFLEHVGRAPSQDHQLDRIDNDGNYEPGNVKWSTRSQQIRNSSKARYLEYDGKNLTIGDWSKITGLNRQTIQSRLDKQGMSVEEALTTSLKKPGNKTENRNKGKKK